MRKRAETTPEQRAAIDAAVLDVIRDNGDRSAIIIARTGLDMREVDRALQRLRKAGRIALISARQWRAI